MTTIYEFSNCAYKRYYANGRPRPCKSFRCPNETCRRKGAEKESAILQRSFQERPPHFFCTLKLTGGEHTGDVTMAKFMKTFCQKIRDSRKSHHSPFEYYLTIEFDDWGQPHVHALFIAPPGSPINLIKELVKNFWTTACKGRSDEIDFGRNNTVYLKPVKTAVGSAKYVTKDVRNRRRVNMPPEEWSGKTCRLRRHSRGFLVGTKKALWAEQIEEWYGSPLKPQPESPHEVLAPTEPLTTELPQPRIDKSTIELATPDSPVGRTHPPGLYMRPVARSAPPEKSRPSRYARSRWAPRVQLTSVGFRDGRRRFRPHELVQRMPLWSRCTRRPKSRATSPAACRPPPRTAAYEKSGSIEIATWRAGPALQTAACGRR